jgi:glycine/D-amino acid oxidase-like deaminating enzyme
MISEVEAQPNKPVWDLSEWTPLPALTTDEECDVCVIGLGGSGLTCISELQANGFQCVGIDLEDTAAGAAGRNGGFLLAGNANFYHDECERLGRERAREMYLETLEELKRIYAEFPELTKNCGSLRLAGDAEEMKDIVRQYNIMREDGLPVQWYVGTEGEGLLIESDGTFNPLFVCR